MAALPLPRHPLGSTIAAVFGTARAVLTDRAFREACSAEEREAAFVRIARLAHRNGLHIAPSVAIGAIFRIRDRHGSSLMRGAQNALSHGRVDVLLLDRNARPVLALDHQREVNPTRAERRAAVMKRRLFERAGLPLFVLSNPEDWPNDMTKIEQRLADLAAQGR